MHLVKLIPVAITLYRYCSNDGVLSLLWNLISRRTYTVFLSTKADLFWPGGWPTSLLRNAQPKETAAHIPTTFLSWNQPITASVPFLRTFLRQISLLKIANQRVFFFNLWILSLETSQMNLRIFRLCLGTRKIPVTLEWALFVAEDSSKSKLITRSFQLEKSLWKRKISILACLIKWSRNQVASLSLLTASSQCRSFLLFSICRKLSALDGCLQLHISRKSREDIFFY